MSIRLGGIRASWAIETDSDLPFFVMMQLQVRCSTTYLCIWACVGGNSVWQVDCFNFSGFKSGRSFFLVNNFKWKKENEETMNASMLMFCKHTDVGGCKMQGIVLAAWNRRYFMTFCDLNWSSIPTHLVKSRVLVVPRHRPHCFCWMPCTRRTLRNQIL